MFRISKLADYASVILNGLASMDQQTASARAISGRVQLGEATVRKILKMLAGAGLVNAMRGAGGGYQLAHPADGISIASVITAIEGPMALTHCSLEEGVCDHDSVCAVKDNWQLINRVIMSALEKVSLRDISRPMDQHALVLKGVSYKSLEGIKAVVEANS